MPTTMIEHKRRESDKQRLLASELLSGPRGSHPYQQIYNFANEVGRVRRSTAPFVFSEGIE